MIIFFVVPAVGKLFSASEEPSVEAGIEVEINIPEGASGDQIGYLYEEGIYINPASRSGDQLPYLADINDDNDLITAAWIGESGSNVLMATQENGFWIITLDRTDYEASAIHQYDPETDGALSLYL